MKKILVTLIAFAFLATSSPASASALTEKIEKQAVSEVKSVRAKSKVHKISHSGLCTSFAAQEYATRAAKARKPYAPSAYTARCGGYKANFLTAAVSSKTKTGKAAVAAMMKSSKARKVVLAKSVRGKKAVTYGVGVAQGKDGKVYTALVVASHA